MRIASRMLALAALLVCTACAEKSTTTNALSTVPRQEFSSVRWEDAISANQSAAVSNGKLIFMR